MKKLKLFYSIEDNFPPFRVDVVELFGNELRKMNVDVVWYMRRQSKGPYSEVEFLGQSVFLPFRPNSNKLLGKLITKLAFWSCDVLQLLNCFRRNIDIIQVRDKYLSSMVAVLVSRIMGVPFIYWCSYPFPEHYQELSQLTNGLKKLYYFFQGWFGKVLLYKLIMPLSDHVFVQSDKMLDDISKYGVSKGKMTPVPMGVPHRLLDWVQENKLKVEPFTIVYIGIMTPERRLNMLIDAFYQVSLECKLAKLIMVGDGVNPIERKLLENQVNDLGLKDRVTFTGFVPIEEAWTYAATASVCLSPFYPSKVLNSASPTKLNEYMALGRPVVCNHHPEQTALVNEVGVGICVNWDASEFANAIIWMLKHPEEAELMGARGPAWVATNRTYPILANLVLSKYKQLLKKNISNFN